MASLAELATANTPLSNAAISHLQRLVGSWALPCDLAFADLLLYAPVDSDATSFVVLGHIRSSTGPTSHAGDPVGRIVASSARPMVQRCFIDGLRFESPMAEQVSSETLDTTVLEGQSNSNWTRSVMVDHVPVRHEGEIIAVLTREGEAGLTRIHSGLEREYRELFQRFAVMVEEGTFPLGRPEKLGEFREPRVGDGVMVLDRERRIEFASPNAVSALHRLGV